MNSETRVVAALAAAWLPAFLGSCGGGAGGGMGNPPPPPTLTLTVARVFPALSFASPVGAQAVHPLGEVGVAIGTRDAGTALGLSEFASKLHRSGLPGSAVPVASMVSASCETSTTLARNSVTVSSTWERTVVSARTFTSNSSRCTAIAGCRR